METKSYTTIDRVAAGWPSGPWDGEPDKVQWQDEATGLPCLAVRQSYSGHWCGYVGVTEGHRHFGKDYNEIHMDVHGGLTYADFCQPGETEATGVCHVPGAGEPDHLWWLGFDCAHCGDLSPLGNAMGFPVGHGDTYKSLNYVQDQCRELARQLAAVRPGIIAAVAAALRIKK